MLESGENGRRGGRNSLEKGEKKRREEGRGKMRQANTAARQRK